MIRFFTLFSVLAQLTIDCLAQKSKYFEGKVYYTYEVTSKKIGVDAKRIKKIVGDSSTLSFKDGNYHHNYSAGIIEFDTYNQQENKYYFKKRNNDTIYWSNCGEAGDKISKFDSVTNKEVILGIKCKKLIIHYKNKTVTHYYNSDSLSIDPDWFKNYILNDQNQVDQKEKAIYLKSEVEFPNFRLVETANKIERKKISSNVFEISPDAILVEKKTLRKN